MNQDNEPKRAGDILGGMNLEAKFEELIRNAPEARDPEPDPEPTPRILNDSFFPEYREPGFVPFPDTSFADELRKTRGIVDKGGIGLLIGSHGTGKTRLLAETARATYWRGARYMKTHKFFSTIRATYSRNAFKTEDEIKEELTRLPLLCLDEIDKRSETKNENALLFAVIDDRFDLGKPTLISGNIHPNQLTDKIDPALISRARVGGGLILFEGADLRPRTLNS